MRSFWNWGMALGVLAGGVAVHVMNEFPPTPTKATPARTYAAAPVTAASALVAISVKESPSEGTTLILPNFTFTPPPMAESAAPPSYVPGIESPPPGPPTDLDRILQEAQTGRLMPSGEVEPTSFDQPQENIQPRVVIRPPEVEEDEAMQR